jgi:hypothetical protein
MVLRVRGERGEQREQNECVYFHLGEFLLRVGLGILEARDGAEESSFLRNQRNRA